jgi:hypothetical protein
VFRSIDKELKRVASIGLDSGYINRSIDKFPKEGVAAPWRLHQNYFLDLLGLRFGSIKEKDMEGLLLNRGRTAVLYPDLYRIARCCLV